MRCLSCGSMNAPHVLECVKCRAILDPIAAAATVGIASDPANLVASAPDPLELPPVSARPVVANSAASVGGGRWQPVRPNLGSADLEFLADSSGSTRLREMGSKNPNGLLVEGAGSIECPRCNRVVERKTMVMVRVSGEQAEYLCRDCFGRATRKEELAPARQARRRMLGGFGAGLVAAIVCIQFATQFGLSPERSLNWQMAIPVGLIVGLAVRLGALNKPNMMVQGIALVLAAVALVGSAYLCLDRLYGPNLAFGNMFTALQQLSPSFLDYALVVVGLILAPVVPSGIVGGHKEGDV